MMLHAATGADTVYTKRVSSGKLCMMKFNDKNRKRVLTIDKRISKLDADSASRTKFISIGSVLDGPSSKVKAITIEDSLSDEHFCGIFDVTARGLYGYPVCNGVSIWTPKKQQEAARTQDRARETEDLLVQQQVMEEDPEAFGGSTTMSSGSKMMVATSSTVEEDDVESGGSTTEVILHEVIKGLTDASAAQQLRLEEALAAKEVAVEALAILEADSFLIGDKEISNQEELKTAVEEALAAKKTVEQEFVAFKTTAEQELLASKAAEAEALSAKTAAFEQKLAESRTTANKALAAKAAAEEALCKEHRRLERVEVIRDELTTQRNAILLAKVDLEAKLKDAYNNIRTFPKKLSDALKKKHESGETEGAAQIMVELAKRTASLEECHKKEIDKLVKGCLRDAEGHISPLHLKIGSLESEVKNLKSQTYTLKEETRLAVKDLFETRRKLKLLAQKKAGDTADGELDFTSNEQKMLDSVEIEKLHAQVIVFCIHIASTAHNSITRRCSTSVSARMRPRGRTPSWTSRFTQSGVGGWRSRLRRTWPWTKPCVRRWPRSATS